MGWESTEALRHFLTGTEIPTQLLDDEGSVTYRWIQSYGLQHGQFPSEQHLAEHLGLRGFDPLQDWTAVKDVLHDRFVQRRLQPALEALMNDLGRSGKHVDALSTLLAAGAEIAQQLDVSHRLTQFVAGAEARLQEYAGKLGSGYNPRIAEMGFPELDRILNGFELSDYILLYAKFKQGKSTIKRQIICNLLRQGKRVLSITLENPAEIETMEMECLFTRTPPSEYLRFAMLPADFVDLKERLEVLQQPGIGECFIYDHLETRDWGSIAALAHRHQVDIVVLDQLTNLAGREWKDIQKAATEGRQFAQQTKIPTLVIHQSDDTGKMKYARAMNEEATKVLLITDTPEAPTEMKCIQIVNYRRGPADIAIPIIFDPANAIIEEMPGAAPPPTTPVVDTTAAPSTLDAVVDSMPWS